jgi:hypothetical protein
VRVDDFIFLPSVVDKLESKHGVTSDEVEEVFRNTPHIRFHERGNVAGENLYTALGRTHAGRYLRVFFIYKRNRRALIVTARDRTKRSENFMPKSKKRREPIPESFTSIEEAAEWWDTHSLADYWDQTQRVELEINLKRSRHVITLEHRLAKRLREFAAKQGITTETLANLLLWEKLSEVAKAS